LIKQQFLYTLQYRAEIEGPKNKVMKSVQWYEPNDKINTKWN